MSEPTPQATYNANLATLASIQKSAEEKYDAILTTLGSAFLAMSLSYVKDVVPLEGSMALWMLYASWVGFAVTIISTVLSLGFGPKAVAWHVSKLKPDEYPPAGLEEQNPWNRRIAKLNIASGASFIIAVVFTVVFVLINTVQLRSAMEKRIPQQGEVSKRGLTIPAMQTGEQKPAESPASGSSEAPAPAPPQPSANGSK
ncbi:hypothetical protein [Quisquiliibacterium transsilvanicum]|uniref:Transmembrane protein n=1 Tax=Quisquiliibacterium transsilvanicum TaxID=1549638 RepID=A0A7W8HKU2_9BURK|nr:hypothetical protein [Quisquiliibacterium transsilvanicum]MBB5273931.1 hypothetical protein [Quisquiliibacterium transsilvanicum]